MPRPPSHPSLLLVATLLAVAPPFTIERAGESGSNPLSTAVAHGAWVVRVGPAHLSAQTPDSLDLEIQRSRLRLEEVREERARLRAEMSGFRSRVEDASRDLQNIEQQISASRSVLAELDFQIESTSTQADVTSARLATTRNDLAENSDALSRRLRDVYKLGPLHSVRVLLGAESVTDLIKRYRYLSKITDYDQALLGRVSALERALSAQDEELRASLRDLERLRQSKRGEVSELQEIEGERQRALETFRSQERETQSRLEQLDQDEGRLTGLIAGLDERRLAVATEVTAGREPPTSEAKEPAVPALSPGDAGKLDWPVAGGVLYRFGREERPDGTVLRWNGLGIAAAPGTPVKAVSPGTVVMAGPFEGYGPTVVVSHGNGFYTLYLYLEDLGVVEGRTIEAGQVIGTVGGRDTPEGPHVEFQIRGPVNGGSPQAMDPLRWLKARPDRSSGS